MPIKNLASTPGISQNYTIWGAIVRIRATKSCITQPSQVIMFSFVNHFLPPNIFPFNCFISEKCPLLSSFKNGTQVENISTFSHNFILQDFYNPSQCCWVPLPMKKLSLIVSCRAQHRRNKVGIREDGQPKNNTPGAERANCGSLLVLGVEPLTFNPAP